LIQIVDVRHQGWNQGAIRATDEAQPDALYTGDQGFEMQEFKRTASRLIEMRSQSYLGLPHGPRQQQNQGWSDNIVET